VPDKDHVDVFVAQLGPEAKKQCLLLIAELREKGVHTLGSLGEASLKSQMGLADKFDARYALVLGKLEVKKGTIILRDMKAGKQQEIPYETAIPEVLRLLGASKLDTYVMKDQMGPEFDED
jgi:histidyl-tRNA synthetase